MEISNTFDLIKPLREGSSRILKPTRQICLVSFPSLLEFRESAHTEQCLLLVGVKDYSQNSELTDLKVAEDDVDRRNFLSRCYASNGAAKP
jgi:hypothetical protein